jgi:Rrf2 family transcriptional regulator, cysteine metabolism repressor
MRLSTTDVYAFKALGYLGTCQGYVGSSAISEATGVPRTYLVRMLAALTAQGLVVSKKGAGGGYALPVAPEQINLRDVIRAVDGPIAPLSCVSLVWPKPCTKESTCHARSAVWLRVRDALLSVLAEVSVADLAQDFRRGVDYSECLGHLLSSSELFSPKNPN